MSKYTPATFQPTVRPDWAGVLSYLSDKEKSEILVALFKYPSIECDSAFWKETIKPDLDLQYQTFIKSCEAKSRGVRDRWDKISITDVKDKDKISIRYDIDTEREREREEEKEEKPVEITKTPEEMERNKQKVHNALEIFGNSYRATDAVVGVFERPDGSLKQGIQIKNPRLMAFIKHRFDKRTLERVSNWTVGSNQRGRTYNASALLKLFCKFQTDIEPAINYNAVQSEYLTFEYKGENKC